MVTASRTALARTALTAAPLTRALALAQWTGASRELTTTGVLRPAVAVEACRVLGIGLPSGKLRSAKDVPELDQAWGVALAADLVRVTANRVSAAPGVAELVTTANGADETAELDDDLAERVMLAWLRGAGMPLGFPGDPCEQCLTVLHELSEANRPVELTDLAAAVLAADDGPAPGVQNSLGSYICPDCGQLHDASDLDPSELAALAGFDLDFDAHRVDVADHAVTAVRGLVDFEAVATGPGRSVGGTVTLTPLGRVLAESVFGTLSPPATDSAEDLVTAIAWLPPKIALIAAAPWLAARSPQAAARALLEFAAAFDGPMLRFVALEIARRAGADAMPVWREYARLPGFGAYARQWVAAQDEPVAADDNDEAWLLVDTILQSGGHLAPGMLPVLSGAVHVVAGDSAAEMLAGIANCGHPHAADVARMLSGGPVTGFRADPENDTLYQLKVTLRGVSKPPVWRRVLVHADDSLGELHEVILAAMGWHGGHLHMFSDGSTDYGAPDEALGCEDEDEFALADVLVKPGDRLRYTYDFGDDWDHDIKLEKVLPPAEDVPATVVPACLAGKGACPPEDCGGAWAYVDLKTTIADPSDEEHEQTLEWLGLEKPSDFDPAAFDLARVNIRLQGPV
jgi:Plasmid pRiA4b ORF-3-like protein